MSRRLLLAALLLLPSGAYAEDLPVAVYRERLVAIDARLQSGDWVGARTAARDLLDDKVVDGRDVLAPDPSVLRPLAEAPTARAARSAGARVA
ncbi:MAG TPA: hypothetical protein DD490_00560, partial [Acidobacteria bacterium]|nr:hypothetical protein [Acidobacteriota bacterium]